MLFNKAKGPEKSSDSSVVYGGLSKKIKVRSKKAKIPGQDGSSLLSSEQISQTQAYFSQTGRLSEAEDLPVQQQINKEAYKSNDHGNQRDFEPLLKPQKMENLERIAEDQSENPFVASSPSKSDIRAHIQTDASESPEVSPDKVNKQEKEKKGVGDEDPKNEKNELRRSFGANGKRKWILIGIILALISLTVTGVLLYFFVFRNNAVKEEPDDKDPDDITPLVEGETEEEKKAREEAERKQREKEEADRKAAQEAEKKRKEEEEKKKAEEAERQRQIEEEKKRQEEEEKKRKEEEERIRKEEEEKEKQEEEERRRAAEEQAEKEKQEEEERKRKEEEAEAIKRENDEKFREEQEKIRKEEEEKRQREIPDPDPIVTPPFILNPKAETGRSELASASFYTAKNLNYSQGYAFSAELEEYKRLKSTQKHKFLLEEEVGGMKFSWVLLTEKLSKIALSKGEISRVYPWKELQPDQRFNLILQGFTATTKPFTAGFSSIRLVDQLALGSQDQDQILFSISKEIRSQVSVLRLDQGDKIVNIGQEVTLNKENPFFVPGVLIRVSSVEHYLILFDSFSSLTVSVLESATDEERFLLNVKLQEKQENGYNFYLIKGENRQDLINQMQMLIGKPYLPPLVSLMPTTDYFSNVQSWEVTKQKGNLSFKEASEKILEFSFFMDEDSPIEFSCKKRQSEDSNVYYLNLDIEEEKLLKCVEEIVEWKFQDVRNEDFGVSFQILEMLPNLKNFVGLSQTIERVIELLPTQNYFTSNYSIIGLGQLVTSTGFPKKQSFEDEIVSQIEVLERQDFFSQFYNPQTSSLKQEFECEQSRETYLLAPSQNYLSTDCVINQKIRSRFLLFIYTQMYEQTAFFDYSLQNRFIEKVNLDLNENIKQFVFGEALLQTISLKANQGYEYQQNFVYADIIKEQTIKTNSKGEPRDGRNYSLLQIQGSIVPLSNCNKVLGCPIDQLLQDFTIDLHVLQDKQNKAKGQILLDFTNQDKNQGKFYSVVYMDQYVIDFFSGWIEESQQMITNTNQNFGSLYKAQIVKELIIYNFNPKDSRNNVCLETSNGLTFRLEGQIGESEETLTIRLNRPIQILHKITFISEREGCKHSDQVFKRHNWSDKIDKEEEYTIQTKNNLNNKADFTFKPINEFILHLRIDSYHENGQLMKEINPTDLEFFQKEVQHGQKDPKTTDFLTIDRQNLRVAIHPPQDRRVTQMFALIADSFIENEEKFRLDFKMGSQTYDIYGLTNRKGQVKLDFNANPVYWFNLNAQDPFEKERLLFKEPLDSQEIHSGFSAPLLLFIDRATGLSSAMLFYNTNKLSFQLQKPSTLSVRSFNNQRPEFYFFTPITEEQGGVSRILNEVSAFLGDLKGQLPSWAFDLQLKYKGRFQTKDQPRRLQLAVEDLLTLDSLPYLFTEDNSQVVENSNQLRGRQVSKTTFVQNSCYESLCDFDNTERMLVLENVFTDYRPLIYMKDFYFSSRDLSVTTLLKRKTSAEMLLGDMLQITTTGALYFSTEVCASQDVQECLEDVALAQYSPGIVLPLSYNSTLHAMFEQKMTEEQRLSIKATFRAREILKPFLESYFLIVEVEPGKLERLGVQQYKGWIKPVAYETPSDIKLSFNQAQPVIVGNQIVAYFPFLQNKNEDEELVPVSAASFKHCKIDKPELCVKGQSQILLSPEPSAHNAFIKEGVLIPARNTDFLQGDTELINQKSEGFLDILILGKRITPNDEQKHLPFEDRNRDALAHGYLAHRGNDAVMLYEMTYKSFYHENNAKLQFKYEPLSLRQKQEVDETMKLRKIKIFDPSSDFQFPLYLQKVTMEVRRRGHRFTDRHNLGNVVSFESGLVTITIPEGKQFNIADIVEIGIFDR